MEGGVDIILNAYQLTSMQVESSKSRGRQEIQNDEQLLERD